MLPALRTTTVPSARASCSSAFADFTRDGHEFAADAVARGAAALVVDHQLDLDVPQVLVTNVRRAMAPAAATFYGDPTAVIELVGVTGTNGKTTTAYLIRSLLEATGRQTGLLGTVKSVIGGVESELARTTPEAIDLQRMFRAMLDGGDVACVMEVSSHALELARVDRSHFSVGVFTNLTQDHLDFHPTMEDYFLAKRRLFTDLAVRRPVINLDDAYGARLATDPEIEAPITFALDHPGATYRADDLRTDLSARSSRCTRRMVSPSCARPCVAASTSTTCSARWPLRVRATCHSTPRWLRSSRLDRCRGGLRPSTRVSPSPCSSIMPIRPTRWRTC